MQLNLGAKGFSGATSPETSPSHSASLQHIVAYANDLQLAEQQHQAVINRLKVRHVASIAPALLRQMIAADRGALRLCLGAWRTSSVQRWRREALAKRQRVLAAALRAGEAFLSARHGRLSANVLACALKAWHNHAGCMRRARRSVEGMFSKMNACKSWSEQLLAATFRMWHSGITEVRNDQLSQAMRARRRPLRKSLSDARCEVAEVQRKLQQAEACSSALQTDVDKVLNATRVALAIGSSTATTQGPSSGQSALPMQNQLDEEQVLAEIEALQQLRSDVRTDLVRAHDAIAATYTGRVQLAEADFAPMSPVPVGLCSAVRQLRGERQQLLEELAAARTQAAADALAESDRKAKELAKERARSHELALRLSEARDLVSDLKARQRRLAAAEVGLATPSSLARLGESSRERPLEGLKEAQGALGALARASERLAAVGGGAAGPFIAPAAPLPQLQKAEDAEDTKQSECDEDGDPHRPFGGGLPKVQEALGVLARLSEELAGAKPPGESDSNTRGLAGRCETSGHISEMPGSGPEI